MAITVSNFSPREFRSEVYLDSRDDYSKTFSDINWKWFLLLTPYAGVSVRSYLIAKSCLLLVRFLQTTHCFYKHL